MKCLIGPNFEPNFRLPLYNSITFNFLDFFLSFFNCGCAEVQYVHGTNWLCSNWGAGIFHIWARMAC